MGVHQSVPHHHLNTNTNTKGILTEKCKTYKQRTSHQRINKHKERGTPNVKLTPSLKVSIAKRIKKETATRLEMRDFVTAYMLLEAWDSAFRVVPYNIYGDTDEKEDGTIKKRINQPTVLDDSASKIFKLWTAERTVNIGVTFNKGRKVVRLVNDMRKLYKDQLIYTLPKEDMFMTCLSSFYVNYKSDSLPFDFPSLDEPTFNNILQQLRNYLANILILDLIEDSKLIDQVLDIYINTQTDNFLETVISTVLEYYEVNDLTHTK